MNKIDNFLNNTTMYRLVVYVLALLSGLSVVFSFMGKLSATPTELILSFALLALPAYITDRGLGRLLKTPTNMESSLITAMILFLIVRPADSWLTALALAAAGAVSSASKFLLSYNGKHIFNPAAFAAALLALTGLQATTWWIGNSVFWPFTIILGLAVVRKIRRAPLFITFVGVSLLLGAITFVHAGQPLATNLKQALLASPLLFLSTIMLTEPATMPPRRNQQILFAALVATLYVFAWKIGPLTIYPEVALLLGNLYAFFVSPKFKIRLRLAEIQKISERVYNYVFIPDRPLTFLPGQYMEWTLANVPYDNRGNRRSFTIASSPTEQVVHLGIKYYDPASMFKYTLAQLKPGDTVYASQLSGNFTLSGNEHKKLVFVAGGIGITPFRSMVKYLSDKQIHADILLLYLVGDPAEFAYMTEFRAAAAYGVRVIPIVTRTDYAAPNIVSGKLSPAMIQQLVPDYQQRLFYISGPNVMVHSTSEYLRELGVPHSNIKTDHFSGY